MIDSRKFVDERLYARQKVAQEYQRIVDKMFGNEKGLPKIFNYPIEKTDIQSMVVAAYHLGKVEREK